MVGRAQQLEPSTVKHCCAAAYDSDAARILLGESIPSRRHENDRTPRSLVELDAPNPRS